MGMQPSPRNPIPEEVQKPMRDRLRLLRRSFGIPIGQIKSLSSSSMTRYELTDISTMQMKDFLRLAAEFGISPTELFSYLMSDGELIGDNDTRGVQRLNVYVRSLNPEMRDLGCDLLKALVDQQERMGTGVGGSSLNRTEALRRNARQILAEAEAEAHRSGRAV